MAVGYRTLILAILVIGILLGLMFGVGAVYGSKTAKPATPIAAAGGGGGGAPGGSAGGSSSAGGSAGGQSSGANPFAGQTLGVVTATQGDSFTVRTANGQTLTFADTTTTPVITSAPATSNDIRQTEFVAVSPGPPDAQGRTRANQVFILPQAFAAALGGGGAPGGGGSPGGAQGGGTPAGGAPPAAP